MENVYLINGVSPPSSTFHQLQGLAVKQTYGLVFKAILSSLINEDNELQDAFKTKGDMESNSGASPDLSAYRDQFVDSFLKSNQGQQILNQFYAQSPLSTDINNIGSRVEE